MGGRTEMKFGSLNDFKTVKDRPYDVSMDILLWNVMIADIPVLPALKKQIPLSNVSQTVGD